MAAVLEGAIVRGMSMLVTRPEYDAGTRYLSHWAVLVMQAAKTKGRAVYDLRGPQANRHEVEGRVRKLRPSFVFLNGHGTTRAVFGQDDVPMIIDGENDALLHGRVTYTVACASAADLGETVGATIGSAYIGYDKKFGVVRHNQYINRPLEDPYAKPILEASNHVPLSLLKGHTCAEAVERAKDVGMRHVQRLQSSLSDSDVLQVAQTLWWNARHLVCLGDAGRMI